MLQSLRKLKDILTPNERRAMYGVFAVTLIVGVLEMVGVASVLPFMAVVSDPSVVEQNRYLLWAYETLGFSEVNAFLVFLGVLAFIMVIGSILFHIISLYVLTNFAHMRAYSLSTRMLRGYLKQPYNWFLNRHSANLGKVILSEVDAVIRQALLPALNLASSSFIVIFIVALLIALNPAVAVGVGFILFGAYAGVFLLARRSLTRLGEIRWTANEQRYRIAQEAMAGIKDVKLLGLEESYVRQFQKPAQRMARANTRKELLGNAPRYLLQGIAFGGMLLVLLFLLMSGTESINEVLPILAVYAFAGLRLLPAVQMVYTQIALLRYSAPAVEALHKDISEIRALEGGTDEGRSATPLRVQEAIELNDVQYAYPFAERQALNGLSLRVPARTTVGIVGGTGAGKTTAVDIVLGLLTPQSGVLKIDGNVIGPETMRAWQSSIGYVPQHIFLTDDSVAANIAFGIPPNQIDHAAVERAARTAELHNFVMNELPKGYGTFVGERGVRLSGGQRQRIGIARALYHDPDVLIMDEATSALDNLTERAVMDAVHNLGRAKTIVLIAHRLSTVRDCDTIFMLDGGRLMAEGSYDELIERNRQFRALAVGQSN